MYKENPNLKYVELKDVPSKNILGRIGEMTQPLPLLFNGSGVEVVVTGSDLWIEMESDCDFHEPWIAYELNGFLMGRQMLLPGEHSICLFRNMSPEVPKKVRVFRENQAMGDDDYVKILVKGFRLDGEFMDVPEFDMKIEFIGDSITSGEGTYGFYDDMDWLTMYMSVSRNYAHMVAKELNADYHLLSEGGWGVYTAWDNDIRHNIPSIYEEVCGSVGNKIKEELAVGKPYDFSWQPDIIVVNLGTNDNTSFTQPPYEVPGMGTFKNRINEDGTHNREDDLKIIKAVKDFLKLLRKHNPTAHIVWVYGMLGYELTPVLSEAVNEYRLTTGDLNVAFLNLPNTFPNEYGSHMHPGYESHRKASQVLVDYIKSKVN